MDYLLMECIQLEAYKNGAMKEWGHRHPEAIYEEETYRTNFRRQRDKILYTGGFRRLQDKTQVISAIKSGDHRTRLTHTLEVEQIAISLSDALCLNSDLVSAIAIGHDVGHTPFGHAVERVLNAKMKEMGGFSHAVQSVKYLCEKIVKESVTKSVEDTQKMEEVRKLQDIVFEGILKHDTDVYIGNYDNRQWDCTKYKLEEAGTLEMQIVYWADKIAYLTHDFEDFYHTEIYYNAKKNISNLEDDLKGILANLIPAKKEAILSDIKNFETRDLIRSIISELIRQSKENITSSKGKDSESLKRETTEIIKRKEREFALREKLPENELSVNYIKEIEAKFEKIDDSEQKEEMEKKIEKIKEIKKDAYIDGLMINLGDQYRKSYKELRKLLNKRYIFSPEITRSDAKAEKIASCLFNDFVNNSKLLPLNIQDLIITPEKTKGKYPLERVVADYIASMTDRYAEQIYSDLNAIGGNYEY